MRFGKFLLIGFVGLLLCLAIGSAYAAQVIYVEVSTYDRALSQFNVDVKGNKWVETAEKGAINGTAFGAPGDNNHATDGGEPYLVIKLPAQVKAGESTKDGKKWAAWARLYQPQALIDATNYNSFFLRTSPDAKTWTPAARADTTLRWNDPTADQIFPKTVNNVDVLFTDLKDTMPWFWLKHTANAQSTIDPSFAVGDNYIEIGVRESDVTAYPRIDVICFRNDDKLPSDAEVAQYITPVQPVDKLATNWGRIKL